MAYCGPLGIPHSKFLGWNEDDQDKALAWMWHDRSKCQSCRTFPEEYLDAEGKFISPPPMVVRTATCYGCLLIKDKTDEIGDKNLTGISMWMVPNPDYKDAR